MFPRAHVSNVLLLRVFDRSRSIQTNKLTFIHSDVRYPVFRSVDSTRSEPTVSTSVDATDENGGGSGAGDDWTRRTRLVLSCLCCSVSLRFDVVAAEAALGCFSFGRTLPDVGTVTLHFSNGTPINGISRAERRLI